MEDLEERLTLSVVALPNDPSQPTVAVFVVSPSAPSPNNSSVAIASTDQPVVASPPAGSNAQSLAGSVATSNGSSSSTSNSGPTDKQLPPQFFVFPGQLPISGSPQSLFSLQTQTPIAVSQSIPSGGILLTAGPVGRSAPGEQTIALGTSFGFVTTADEKAFLPSQDAMEPAFPSSPAQNQEPILPPPPPSAGTVIDTGSVGKFASMEDAVAHAAPWVTVLAPTGLGIRTVDGQRLFVDPVISELPGALTQEVVPVASEPGTDPLGLGFGPLRSLAQDMLGDLGGDQSLSAVGQPGMWLVAAATLWAVFPRRNRTPQRPDSESRSDFGSTGNPSQEDREVNSESRESVAILWR